VCHVPSSLPSQVAPPIIEPAVGFVVTPKIEPVLS